MIPAELRDIKQWLVSGANKIPISPLTGVYTDVHRRDLYVSYSQAVEYALQYGMEIGFVLTPDDPFTVIDLDKPDETLTPEERQRIVERQKQIYEAFLSYTELSRSREGVHIWCRGSVTRGVRRDGVELYPQDRYMITTGLTIRELPIADYQSLLETLFHEMGGENGYGTTELVEEEETDSDTEIFEMAIHAVNGEKFDLLTRGDWQYDYPSQSEADFALIDMLCYYSRSNEQVKRMFRYSVLGKRQKAQREDYLNRMIVKARAEEVPLVDFSGLLPQRNGRPEAGENGRAAASLDTSNSLVIMTPDEAAPSSARGWDAGVDMPNVLVDDIPRQELTPTQDPPPVRNSQKATPSTPEFTMPPGFVGEIARYIYDTSTRPVVEVAVAAALAMTAGIVGRQFNVSGTGLNQYLILLARTGVGKEGGSHGIERLLKAVRNTVPAIDSFVGPGVFASGQAIIRTLDKQPCFFSVLGEFGFTLQDLSDQNANSLTRTMRRVYLDLYSKSGKGSVLPPSAYSDSQKNTKNLYAPCMTLLGESTPETFYEGLSLNHIESGLIPRFLIIEYQGERPDRNPNAFAPPPDALVQRLADLSEVALRMQANHTWEDVSLDADAHGVLEWFDGVCDAEVRSGSNEGVRQLWNRAHLKALRLAALLAVVDRPHLPVVNWWEAFWATALVKGDVQNLSARFARGDVGEGNSKQIADLERILTDYGRRSQTELDSYKVPSDVKAQGCVPYAYLQRRALPLSSFRRDKRGSVLALETALKTLCAIGTLREVPKAQVAKMFGGTATIYKIV